MPSIKNPSTGSASQNTTIKPLSAKREAELAAKAAALGDSTLVFPGKAARRIAWSSKIQAAAERDAADLIRAPFPKGEPSLTVEEIKGQKDQIQFLRLRQARWRTLLVGVRKADEDFGPQAEEAGKHRKKLLKLFSAIYRNDTKGRRWVADVRAGSGVADLVQDVFEIIERGKLHEDEIAAAPRGEGEAYARLVTLYPTLEQLLAAKSLDKSARAARRERDAAYTLLINTERRFRAAAEYWYDEDASGRLADYAAFPTSSGGEEDEGASQGEASDDAEEDVETDETVAEEGGEEEEGEEGEDAAPADASSPAAKKPVPA